MNATHIFSDTDTLARAAASSAASYLEEALKLHETATWVIAGGTAPLAAYRILAAEYAAALDWSRVNIIIGDERCVPFDSPDSSWSQFEAAFLSTVKVSSFTARPHTDRSPEEAAVDYEPYLRQLPQNEHGMPRLDLVWLGVGEDGHTLSIFPNHPSSRHDSRRLVIAVHDAPKPPPERISLSLHALQGTVSCMVLTSGVAKAEAIGRALAGDTSLPIARAVEVIEGANGRAVWLLDEAAAGRSA